MYVIKGYCACILVFQEEIEEKELQEFLEKKHTQLKSLELQIVFGSMVQPATELCYDVYEKATGKWRQDLSQAFKVDVERLYEWIAEGRMHYLT